MNYGMLGLKEGRESRLNVMKRRTGFSGKTKGRKKRMKKWVCVFAAVWMMIAAMAVASAEVGYESFVESSKETEGLGEPDYCGEPTEEQAGLIRSIVGDTDVSNGYLIVYADFQGTLMLAGLNEKGEIEVSEWQDKFFLTPISKVAVCAENWSTISDIVEPEFFVVLDTGALFIAHDEETAAVLDDVFDSMKGK